MADQLAGIQLVAGHEPAVAHARTPGLFLNLRSRLHGISLDRALAEGADPASSPLLARRTAWLTSSRNRSSLADCVGRLIEVSGGLRGRSAVVRPHRGELAGAKLPLARVAALLDSPEPVYPRGVARVQLLLTDATSPLYAPVRPGQLRAEAEDILDALAGREETW